MMIEDHVHGEDGHIVAEVRHEPEAAEVAAVEVASDSAVEIARIEAERDIQLARLANKAEETHDGTEVEVLRTEVRTLREMIERILPPDPEPEPDPEPIVITDVAPDPEPEPTDLPPAEEHHETQHRRKPIGLGMW